MATTVLEMTGRAVAATVRPRIDSLDLLRGGVMVLMALDHVRDYFTSARFDPLDFSQTSVALFLTRWITHFCAPVFVFLAGTSAYRLGRKVPRAELSRFLWTRGLWLVFLELTVVHFAWTFQPPWGGDQFVQVIWAIGWSMVALAALVWLPTPAVAAFGIAMIAGHNAFDGITPQSLGALGPLWNVLHVQGPTPWTFVAYPLIPWIGVMAAGYAFGAAYDLEPQRRRRLLLGLGAALIGLFVVLRVPNLYGDLHPWSAQDNAVFTFLAVIKAHKYPPSLAYLLMTLGPALIALALFESTRGRAAGWLVTIGRVPLFFYVLHIVLAHALAQLVAGGMGIDLGQVFSGQAQGWGFGLPVVYAVWALVVVLLYPGCRWFAALKARRRDWWLSYL